MNKQIQMIPVRIIKEASITGHLAQPMRVGERAIIRLQTGQSIITSCVKQILEASENSTIFVTCNTLYNLSYNVSPTGTEVNCA